MKKSIVIISLEKELMKQKQLLEKIIAKENAPDYFDLYMKKRAEYNECNGSHEEKYKLLCEMSKLSDKFSKRKPWDEIEKEMDYRIEIEGNIKRLQRALRWAEMSAI